MRHSAHRGRSVPSFFEGVSARILARMVTAKARVAPTFVGARTTCLLKKARTCLSGFGTNSQIRHRLCAPWDAPHFSPGRTISAPAEIGGPDAAVLLGAVRRYRRQGRSSNTRPARGHVRGQVSLLRMSKDPVVFRMGKRCPALRAFIFELSHSPATAFRYEERALVSRRRHRWRHTACDLGGCTAVREVRRSTRGPPSFAIVSTSRATCSPSPVRAR